MYIKNWSKYIDQFNENDEELYVQMISNGESKQWMEREIPKFECPDKVMEETYYFRWWTFRKHIKDISGSRIITEFLPEVRWSGPYNSINCANGHHIAEARWLGGDRELVREYLRFWLQGEGDETSYSSWLVYSAYQYAIVSGEKEFIISLLPDMVKMYQKIEEHNWTRYGLFWSFDDRDAMEMSISGSGLRPTLNSYMYANAYALAQIARWAGNEKMMLRYTNAAKALKEKICNDLWDETDEFFKVVPQKNKDAQIKNFKFEEIPLAHNVRESIGYIPWSFSIPAERYDIAWKFLTDKRYFKAEYGPTTAERKHPAFMQPCEKHECLWNGPSWPFATTQILNSLIELLQQKRDEWIKKDDFICLMHTYAKSHFRKTSFGKVVNWIDENIEPDSGEWLSRRILEEWNWRQDKGGYERGKDYNHSAFCDLVIRGICGVQITDDDQLRIQPLLSEEWEYFMLENLIYKGHRITIAYDKKGEKYSRGIGLWAEVDGKLAAQTTGLDEIAVKL